MLLTLYGLLAVVGYLAFAEWLGLVALRYSNAQAHPVWALLLGLVVLGLATIIPVLGALAVFGSIVFGVGAVALSGWQKFHVAPVADRMAPNGRVVAPPQPVAV